MTIQNLAQAQAEMKLRQQRKRAPKLERGVYVAPIRRRKPIADFPELQKLLCAHLRSPKIKASEFHKLMDLGTRYGLILPDIRPIPPEEAEGRPDLSPEMQEVLRLEKQMREQRKKAQEKKQ